MGQRPSLGRRWRHESIEGIKKAPALAGAFLYSSYGINPSWAVRFALAERADCRCCEHSWSR